MLLLLLVDAAQRVDAPLNTAQKAYAALEHGGHVAAERTGNQNEDRREDGDLDPTVCSH